MRTGICPKCTSETVYAASKGIRLGDNSLGVAVFIGMFGTPSSYTAYLCSTCGYVEFYIDDRSKLQAVESNWHRVLPPTSGPPPLA